MTIILTRWTVTDGADPPNVRRFDVPFAIDMDAETAAAGFGVGMHRNGLADHVYIDGTTITARKHDGTMVVEFTEIDVLPPVDEWSPEAVTANFVASMVAPTTPEPT
jgi:hypothetical protein